MESVGALGSPIGGSSNSLSLPASPWEEDEESLGLEGIKPKSSPTPRRRSSASSDDSLPPPSSSRRVSFADAFGLSLVSVKQFDAWGATPPSGPLESDLNEDKEYYMVPLFTLPQTSEELELRVHEQKLELESLELLSGTTTLRGIVRVLNVCFDKMVYVRTSLDSWRSHFDLLAEYSSGSNNGEMDCFSFKLTLVPPFGEEGARVDFCLRYETSVGTFWANNSEKNYSLLCCEKLKEKGQSESENRRKSCLKITSTNSSASTSTTTNNEKLPVVNLNDVKATDPESVSENSEKSEKESKELAEEMSRNRSRRNRRKAARLQKVKEHFAKREEEQKRGTKTKESEVTAETSTLRLEMTTCSSLSQQTPQPPTDTQISSSPAESLKSTDDIGDSKDICCIDNIINFSKAQTNLPLGDSISCDETVTSSASEVLKDVPLKDNVTDQKVSNSQSFPECQNSDLSISKDVERAWEHFEKDAKQRIKHLALSLKVDEDVNVAGGNREDNVSLKTANTETQLFSQGFTFRTIVAPLYHQVFKNMEIEKKDFTPKILQVNRSFKELKNKSLTAVTTPETFISLQREVHNISVDDCKASTDQNKTVNPTKSPLSESNKSECVEDSHNQNDPSGYPTDIIFIEANLPKVTSSQLDPSLEECKDETFQYDYCHSLFPLQAAEHFVNTNQATESDIDNLSEQIHPSAATSALKTLLSLNTEMSQNQEDPTNIRTKEEDTLVQTENSIINSCILAKSPDDPTTRQTSGINLEPDKLEPDCCKISYIEKPEDLCDLSNATAVLTEQCSKLDNTEIIMCNTMQTCNMNGKKAEFSSKTTEKECSNIIDFEGEQITLANKEVEDGSETTNSESLEEEEEGTRKGEKEKDQDPEEHEGEKDKQENKGGLKSIEDELKYIDDEEDLDEMKPERENKQVDADYLVSLERDSEDQKRFNSTCNVQSVTQRNIDLNECLCGVEVLENQESFISGVQICEETGTSWQESSQKSDTEVSGSTIALENSWDAGDQEMKVFCESKTMADYKNMEYEAKDSLSGDSGNTEDNTSTESQIDEEMELYLNSLRNSQQSAFREGTMSGSKRPSISRRRPSMPSISESVDEDHQNSSLEDLSNIALLTESKRAMLPLVDRNERVIGRNVLWWKKFLSYDNMKRMIGYTFLLIVFLVLAYHYDFIACFALYLLTVYWLFHQGEGEPLKKSQNCEKRLQ
ncbi:protein phosphatase 1 regulatory subunit 3A [Danio rerio]|uniref:Protein phosphatase 1 regulatory subunit 3A n=1 Tax=Danio rerio TaxID=7955 RepID=A0ACD6B5E2_DANRE|nr:protein phosphatase 1 regulatory subunit 3A [Danio rerio]|eukprot:XP_001341298.4 protein phosphatase 1 regulatory subunit 3A [Danio rerio]